MPWEDLRALRWEGQRKAAESMLVMFREIRYKKIQLCHQGRKCFSSESLSFRKNLLPGCSVHDIKYVRNLSEIANATGNHGSEETWSSTWGNSVFGSTTELRGIQTKFPLQGDISAAVFFFYFQFFGYAHIGTCSSLRSSDRSQ